MKGPLVPVAVQGRFGRLSMHASLRPIVEHAHLEFNFVFWVDGCPAGFRVGRQEAVLDASSAILVNPWLPHANLGSPDGPTQVLSVLLDPDWLAQVLELPDLPLVRLFSQPCVAMTREVRGHVDTLVAAMSTGRDAREVACEPLVRALVLAVTDAHADPDMRRTFHRRDSPMDARIARALALIRDAATRPSSLDGIAARVGLSRSRFFEQFKACVGASPHQVLDWARLEVATRLLAGERLRVAEVSREVGFSAPSHFARFFVQHMGMTPGDFRRGVINEGA